MSHVSSLPSGKGNMQQRYPRDENFQCLGRGSFGTVYRFKDTVTNKYVAIKELYTGDNCFEEVKKEITNLEKLKSPYIVRLIDHFDDPSTKVYRLVMEYCSGGSLKGKIFGDDELLIVAEHILNGLHYMHSRGFIHRDIKPDNLLCHEEKNKTVYKLGDLGSSKNMEYSVKTYTGTVSFMAPEILKLKGIKPKSGKHYNYKVDIWSFGATILHLGEGNLCKIECNPKFKKIKNEKLKKLIQKCLIMDPKKRPPVDTLRKYLQSEDENHSLDNFAFELTTVLESETLESLARSIGYVVRDLWHEQNGQCTTADIVNKLSVKSQIIVTLDQVDKELKILSARGFFLYIPPNVIKADVHQKLLPIEEKTEPSTAKKSETNQLNSDIFNDNSLKNVKLLESLLNQNEVIELIDAGFIIEHNTELTSMFISGRLKYAIYAQQNKHMFMIIFEHFPECDDDIIIRIEWLFFMETKKTILRIQPTTAARFLNNAKWTLFNKGYPLNKSMDEIIAWCIEYTQKNAEYNFFRNNSRKFIYNLCKFLGDACPAIHWAESALYKMF